MITDLEVQLREIFDHYIDYNNDPSDPEFILANYLAQCLETFNIITKKKK